MSRDGQGTSQPASSVHNTVRRSRSEQRMLLFTNTSTYSGAARCKQICEPTDAGLVVLCHCPSCGPRSSPPPPFGSLQKKTRIVDNSVAFKRRARGFLGLLWRCAHLTHVLVWPCFNLWLCEFVMYNIRFLHVCFLLIFIKVVMKMWQASSISTNWTTSKVIKQKQFVHLIYQPIQQYFACSTQRSGPLKMKIPKQARLFCGARKESRNSLMVVLSPFFFFRSPSYSRFPSASMQYFNGSPTHDPAHMWSPGGVAGLTENEYLKGGGLPAFQRIASSTSAAARATNHYASYGPQVSDFLQPRSIEYFISSFNSSSSYRPTPGPRTTRRTASRRLARRAATVAVPPPPSHPRRPSRRRHRSLQVSAVPGSQQCNQLQTKLTG